jgi:hypothetical protein
MAVVCGVEVTFTPIFFQHLLSAPPARAHSTSAMPLQKFGDYRYLNGRRVVHGLHPALVGHVATRGLPHSVRLTKQQMNWDVLGCVGMGWDDVVQLAPRRNAVGVRATCAAA